MNISSISTKVSFCQTTNNNTNEIKALQKQKEQLQEQIKKVNESDQDKETKQEAVKVLKDQINLIDSQIQQKQTEKASMTFKTKQSEEIESNSENTSKANSSKLQKSSTGIEISSMSSLIEADVTYSKAEVLTGVKTSLEGRSGVLAQEISLDASRGVDTEAKSTELNGIKANVRGIERDLGEAAQVAADATEKTSQSNDMPKTETEENEDRLSEAAGSGDEAVTDKTGELKKDGSSNTWIIRVDDKNKKVDVTV